MQSRNRRMKRGLIPLITDIRHVHVEILAYTQGKTIHTYISYISSAVFPLKIKPKSPRGFLSNKRSF